MTIYIYGLIDPTNNKISYIGQSVDPDRRWSQHCTIEEETIKGVWIKQLAASGHTPTVVVLDTVYGGSATDVEHWWIEFGRRMGWPLMNSTPDKYDLDIVMHKPPQYLPWVYEEANKRGMTTEEYMDSWGEDDDNIDESIFLVDEAD